MATSLACEQAVQDLKDMFQSLGFFMHETKSVSELTCRLKFLGFWLDSIKMTVSLTQEKQENFCNAIESFGCRNSKIKIWKDASVVGLMVAYSKAVKFAGHILKS